MAGELIFLTGATGHIGLRVLVFALRAGYRVRAAVRNLAKTDAILATASIRALAPGSSLTFVEVPDMMTPGAFDQALQGVEYVIHVAAPISAKGPDGADFAEHFRVPIVDGSLSLLDAARKHDTVRRVVITSSISGMVDRARLQQHPEAILTEESRVTDPIPPPYHDEFQAYGAAKAEALIKLAGWVADEQPGFELTFVVPGFVLGPNELVTDPDEMLLAGTNRLVLFPVTGRDAKMTGSTTAHLDDVAMVHVRVLDPALPGNCAYLVHSGGVAGTKHSKCLEIAARNFPNEIGKTLANNGRVQTLQVNVDASNTEKLLGVEFIGHEKQVTDLVAYYLECLKKKQAATAA